ncbi:MAG: hypothetical protein GY796_36475 [Chloroflexi bacterium]|nr:hypothetical protein [Chloroflexota bacterium]
MQNLHIEPALQIDSTITRIAAVRNSIFRLGESGQLSEVGMMKKTIWSYGGGRQSIAILVLIAQGKLPKPDLIIMSDTSRERASTWRYQLNYGKPLMDKLELPFVVASHDLSTVDLYAHNGDLLLPTFTTSGGKLPTFCSNEWKKYVTRRKLRKMGFGPKNPITMWFGMSIDEISRLRHSDVEWITNHYPLCFDYPLRSFECIKTAEDYGLPTPPHSSCWMCPNMDNREWRKIKSDDPADFQAAIELDYQIREKDTQGGVFLHRSLVPLDKADLTIKSQPAPLLECSTGYCFT